MGRCVENVGWYDEVVPSLLEALLDWVLCDVEHPEVHVGVVLGPLFGRDEKAGRDVGVGVPGLEALAVACGL